MKNIFLFSSLFLLARASAQINLPPVFEVKADTSVTATLPNKYWQILEDKGGNLKLC